MPTDLPPRINCRVHGWNSTVPNTEYKPRWRPRAEQACCYVCNNCALAQFEPFEGNHVVIERPLSRE